MSQEFPTDEDEGLAEFADLMTEWHQRKVANLRNVQEGCKEGTLIKMDDETGSIAMEERDALFFKLGIETALIELGTLPFKVERNDDDIDEDDEEVPA